MELPLKLLAAFLCGLLAGGSAHAAAGDLDTTFGSSGVTLAEIGDEGARAMLVLPDGKLLTATIADASARGVSLLLTRFLGSGALDTTFATAGTATLGIADDELGEVNTMVRQGDGKIVLAGRALESLSLVRVSAAGALDAGFGSGGVAAMKIGGDDEAFAVALDGDGKAVAAGRSDSGTNSDFAVVRLTTTGVPDPTFSGDGRLATDFGGEDEARAVVVQGDAMILAVGGTDHGDADLALARYTSAGVLDGGFGTGGKVVTHVSDDDDVAYAALVLPDGRIVVAGKSGDDFLLARYSSTGALDTGFGSGGFAVADVSPGEIDAAAALVRQGDGRLIAGGAAHPAGTSDFALVRRVAGGGADASFGSAGKVTTEVTSTFNEEIYALALQADGRLLAAGLGEDGLGDYQMIARYHAGSVAPVCGNAIVEAPEECDDGNTTFVKGEFCDADCTRIACGKPTGSAGDAPTASDALYTLRVAVGIDTCDSRVCDTESSGSVTAADALRVLKAAVGQPIVLNCPV